MKNMILEKLKKKLFSVLKPTLYRWPPTDFHQLELSQWESCCYIVEHMELFDILVLQYV